MNRNVRSRKEIMVPINGWDLLDVERCTLPYQDTCTLGCIPIKAESERLFGRNDETGRVPGTRVSSIELVLYRNTVHLKGRVQFEPIGALYIGQPARVYDYAEETRVWDTLYPYFWD